MKEQYDAAEGYCRMLGHPVSFAYCRAGTGPLPCRRIADCWFERLPIEDFLRRTCTPQELAGIFAPRPGKLASILQIVQNVTGARNDP
jgi:hypothetical protein